VRKHLVGGTRVYKNRYKKCAGRTMGVTTKGGRILGYARVSTREQNLDLQIDALKKAGVHPNHLFVEKASATAKHRPKLKLLLKSLRPGDRVVFWKFDRLARNILDLHTKVAQIKAAGAEYISLTEHFDTSSAVGMLMFNILASFAQFERDMTIERTIAGARAAKARGVQFGQPKKLQGKDGAKIVVEMQKMRKAKTPWREIRQHVIDKHKKTLSVTTIEKYVTGKVKI